MRAEFGPEVTTLGEALVVLDPLSTGPLRHVEGFRKRVGGAELNVAVALSRLGHRVSWHGALGDDEFGAEVRAFLRAEGVDDLGVAIEPKSKTGIYFKEKSSLGRLGVYYYRSGSAASRLRFEHLDLDRVLSAGVLHLTGITPGLSEGARDLTERLVEEANFRNVVVSFDANVRFRLFEDRDPREVILPLVERADLLFLSDEEASLLLNCESPKSVRQAARHLRARTVVVHGASGAFAVEEGDLFERPAYPVELVDPVGAGDAFVAGFLSGRLRRWDVGRSLELANACGACAVTVPGDAESMPFETDAMTLVRGTRRTER